MEATNSNSGPVDQALAEYFASVDRRETIDVSRLIAAFPGREAEMRKFLENERRLTSECRKMSELAAPAITAPAQIGRFKIERALGSGAFGVVYLAHDDLLKRPVAIKVPLPQMVADEESRRRFEAEASAAARLDHPGIVAVYEADFSGPIPYIASAFCPGPDLGRWLTEREQPIPWQEAALFLAKLAEAVHYAHQEGVRHRDLKPSNVLLLPKSQVSQCGCAIG